MYYIYIYVRVCVSLRICVSLGPVPEQTTKVLALPFALHATHGTQARTRMALHACSAYMHYAHARYNGSMTDAVCRVPPHSHAHDKMLSKLDRMPLF